MKKIITITLFVIILFSLNQKVFAGTNINGEGACIDHKDYDLFASNNYYDGVEICGLCYACDGVYDDGVCPEDYGDETRRASCTNHPDINCVARVSGTIKSLEEGQELADAEIKILPPPGSGASEVTINSDSLGNYFVEEIPAGRWVFKISKSSATIGYDTVIEEKIIEYGKTNIFDFYLPEGSCNNDCTDSFGRCNPDCEGINGCHYSNLLIKELCKDQTIGTEIIVNQTDDFVIKELCCTGGASTTEYRPKAVIHGDMKKLVLREVLARMNNDIVKIKLAVWE